MTQLAKLQDGMRDGGSTVAELAQQPIPTSPRAVFVIDGDRSGNAVFDTSDLSADVAADPSQDLYIAPDSDPTGASGAWVRQFENWEDIENRPSDRILTGRYQVDGNGDPTTSATQLLVIPNPEGATYYNRSSTPVGAFRIDLPQLWTSTMMTLKVREFSYYEDAVVNYTISGYNRISTVSGYWTRVAATATGQADRVRRVRFGSKNGKASIWIGEPGDVSNFPSVTITEGTFQHDAATLANWQDGWNIVLDNDPQGNFDGETGIDPQIFPTAGDAIFGRNILDNDDAGFGVARTLATRGDYRTDVGVASAIAGQGALATQDEALTNLGSTGARPSSPAGGTVYFDTTIGKPIWYDGANWVDATGSTV